MSDLDGLGGGCRVGAPHAHLPQTVVEGEETLTERILADLLEQVLGFGRTDYVPQLSRSGMKPDFTPSDLVAHRFVLDASSRHTLPSESSERQIRGYMEQRRLDHGLLFNSGRSSSTRDRSPSGRFTRDFRCSRCGRRRSSTPRAQSSN